MITNNSQNKDITQEDNGNFEGKLENQRNINITEILIQRGHPKFNRLRNRLVMKRLTTRLLILNLFIIVSVFSQNNDDAIRITDNQIGFGARALGMGGAYMAISEDYSAVYWNPAGLAQMRKMEIWLGISHVHFGNDIKFPNYSNNTIQNYTTSTASISATKLNSFGIALPVPTYRGSLVFAIGYQKVKDFESANEFLIRVQIDFLLKGKIPMRF
jgi:hypothetical protein